MDVLADPELLAAVKARFAAGVVFGGTSAGAAVMSARMITGEGDFTVIDGDKVEVRPGLGLLEGAIVDQHFVKRQRENRLFGLVLKHPEERGVGIDEDTALLVTGGRYAEVVGKGPVMLVDAKGPDRLAITLLRAGQTDGPAQQALSTNTSHEITGDGGLGGARAPQTKKPAKPWAYGWLRPRGAALRGSREGSPEGLTEPSHARLDRACWGQIFRNPRSTGALPEGRQCNPCVLRLAALPSTPRARGR